MNFIDPKTTIQQMELREGMKVGDFGAGSGHYTLAASRIIGTDGIVYAIDVQEDVLKHIDYLAKQDNLNNIKTIWCNFEKKFGTKLRENILDAVILSNVLFQIEDRYSAIEEIKRTLKPGGVLLVVEWSGSYGGIGPAPESVITQKEAEEIFTNAGFSKVKDTTQGKHHYGIVFSLS